MSIINIVVCDICGRDRCVWNSTRSMDPLDRIGPGRSQRRGGIDKTREAKIGEELSHGIVHIGDMPEMLQKDERDSVVVKQRGQFLYMMLKERLFQNGSVFGRLRLKFCS